MRRSPRVIVFIALPAIWAQTPEAFSPGGKAFSARPDPEHTIAAADLALAKEPASADLLLAAARARDAVLRFSESLPLYTRGMDEYPGDVRFPRYRGHRFISTRKFDFAIADLKRAAEIAREYQRCLAMAAQPKPQFMRGMPVDWRPCQALDDNARVAITEWAWRATRRAGKPEEAEKLLATITESMKVTDNQSYYRTLLLYKGLRTEADALAAAPEANSVATLSYGVGVWHWLAGRKEQACAAWERAVSGENWSAFGFIAAEGELARGACKPARKR